MHYIYVYVLLFFSFFKAGRHFTSGNEAFSYHFFSIFTNIIQPKRIWNINNAKETVMEISKAKMSSDLQIGQSYIYSHPVLYIYIYKERERERKKERKKEIERERELLEALCLLILCAVLKDISSKKRMISTTFVN